MNRAENIPWKNYSVIAELAVRMKDRSPQFGKTALQKLIYILQQVYKIDLEYEYSFYSYGPFCSLLMGDLDTVERLGGVQIQHLEPLTGGYSIQPGNKAEALREKSHEFLASEEVQKAIDSLTEEFGDKSAKELELRATILYIADDSQRSENYASTRSEMLPIVMELKPKFDSDYINRAIDELIKMGHLKLD